jgi:hypothetical protein
MPDQDQIAAGTPEPASQGQDVETQTTPEVAPTIPEETWEKRYKDSQREFEKKWKPMKEKSDFVAQQVGFQTIDELYEAARAEEMQKREQTPAKEPVAEKKPEVTVSPELDKRLSTLEADRKEKKKQEIDKEFDVFYEQFPEAKEMEADLVDMAKPLWGSKGKKGFKYSRLQDALKDAYLVLNKEKFMEQGKLEAFAKLKAEQGASQSLLGNTSKSKKDVSDVQLTAEDEKVYQAQFRRGIFKDRKEYLKYSKKQE